MNTSDLVRYISTGERPLVPARRASTLTYHELVSPTRIAILRARQFLFAAQRADGTWCGKCAGNASLAAQWILLLAYLGEEHGEECERAARAVADAQLPNGGWSRFLSGPFDISVSVQAYFALKLAGHDPASDAMSRARDAIRSNGGADAADVTTRLFLALLGQISYDCFPAHLPESLLFNGAIPRDFAAAAVLWSHRPVRDVGWACGVRELFVDKPGKWPSLSGRPRASSRMVRYLEHCGWMPLRRRALNRAESLLLSDVSHDQITRHRFNELVLRLVALDTLGHGRGSLPFDSCRDRLRKLVVDENREQSWPQLFAMPLPDTALTLRTFHASGISLRHLLGPSATTWLARRRGLDANIETIAAGWLFEALRAAGEEPAHPHGSLPPDLQVESNTDIDVGTIRDAALRSRAHRVAERFVLGLLERQNADGGWGPTADRESTSAPEVVGAVLQSLADCGGARVHASVQRAIAYLRATQRADGSWASATGVRFVHGTSLAICGLAAAGITLEDDDLAAGINWLVVHQLPSGGWGELPFGIDAADDFTAGPATATQTAWALSALVAAGLAHEETARRAVHFLVDTQDDVGGWREQQFTLRDQRTGHWFRNDLAATAWPLDALSRWAFAAAAENDADEAPSLRLVGVADD